MIETKIQGLKDNKSPGTDGISPRLLKEIVDDISVPLAIAFTKLTAHPQHTLYTPCSVHSGANLDF